MLSRRLIKDQPGRRWIAFVAGAGLLIATLAIAGFAFAVHDDNFQLDGNVLATCPPAPDTGLCTTTQKDWADLFVVTDDTTAGTQTVTNSSVFSDAGPFTTGSFIRDFRSGTSCTLDSLSTTKFCTADTTTFATGSKDTLDINQWECNRDNNVNSKIDIMNAYAASYTATNGDKIMYFALEKNKDNGVNDVGFWFLQGNASCSAPSGHKPFTGSHAIGDVLVVSEFSNGGGVSNITAYRWVGGTNPLQQIATATGAGGDCKTATGGDNICATTNSGAKPFNTTLNTPWLSSDATLGIGNNQIVPPDFFEGGINLTKAFNQSGQTVPSCFNTFIADTRSSKETSATLFDFARGTLGECKTTLTTRAGLSTPPKTGEVASPTTIGGGSVSSGTDTATLTVTGTNNWSGTLTFYLCGPDGSLTKCDQTKGTLVTTTSNVTANGSYVSGTTTLTSAGKYCWSAHFEPSQASKDAGVLVGDDDGTNECFTVGPATPALDTCSGTYSATNVCTPAGTVDFGNSISDRAIVSGLAKEPGSNGGNTNYPTIGATNGVYAGSIQFTLKGPAATGCGVTTANSTVSGETNPQSVNIDSAVGNKVYGPVSYTPGAPGNYHWQATLSHSTSVNNTLPATHNALCNDTDEDVTVRQIPTGVISKQSWIPNDTATVSASTGNLASGGSVVFELWNTATCDGTKLYTETVSVPGGSPTAEVSTSNTGSGATGFKITTNYADAAASVKSGYSWKVTYTPALADTAHLGSSSSCSSENFSITYTNDNTP
jgi:hypothetical protein